MEVRKPRRDSMFEYLSVEGNGRRFPGRCYVLSTAGSALSDLADPHADLAKTKANYEGSDAAKQIRCP